MLAPGPGGGPGSKPGSENEDEDEDTLWTGQITIGSPAETFTVDFDTG